MPDETQTRRARALRAAQGDMERRLWNALRNRRLCGWKWRRPAPVGPFITDFLCVEACLIVELDGGQHGEPTAQAYDARRTAYLKARGLRVIRVWNFQVYENLDGVCEQILTSCGGTAPHPTLSPQERGEGRST